MFFSKKKKQKVVFGPCCFCGENIEESDLDPCRLTVETKTNKWQVWFCHSKCFREKVVKNAILDLEPAHF